MGLISFGMFLGLLAAVGGVAMGASFWACLALYSSGGVIAVFAILLIRPALNALEANNIDGAPRVSFLKTFSR